MTENNAATIENAETAAAPKGAPRTVATAAAPAAKREVAKQEHKGLGVQDLILIAVLKLTVSSFLSFGGMKPNFMIAMYCLAIILTRPKIYQSAAIGLLVGLVSQIPMLNATPMVNIASELLGAVVCGALVLAFAKAAPTNKLCQNAIFPAIITFLSTLVSGYTFAMIVGVAINGLDPIAVLGVYAVMVFGTAVMNTIVVVILTPILRAVLKR